MVGTIAAAWDLFATWIAALDSLPRRRTRVVRWPLATVFGLRRSTERAFPHQAMVTRDALQRCGLPFGYASHPSRPVYKALLDAIRRVRREIAGMRPRDMIDMQSFLRCRVGEVSGLISPAICSRPMMAGNGFSMTAVPILEPGRRCGRNCAQ